jgi:hypothetical protein
MDENSELLEIAQKTRDYAEEQYDKLVVTLASGALALTIVFVKDIVGVTTKNHLGYLKISWILFATTLLVNLLSHQFSVRASDRIIMSDSDGAQFWNTVVWWSNIASSVFLFAGIISFIAFAWRNI